MSSINSIARVISKSDNRALKRGGATVADSGITTARRTFFRAHLDKAKERKLQRRHLLTET